MFKWRTDVKHRFGSDFNADLSREVPHVNWPQHPQTVELASSPQSRGSGPINALSFANPLGWLVGAPETSIIRSSRSLLPVPRRIRQSSHRVECDIDGPGVCGRPTALLHAERSCGNGPVGQNWPQMVRTQWTRETPLGNHSTAESLIWKIATHTSRASQ